MAVKKARTEVDFTRMERGTVTRTFRGRPVQIVGVCQKCGRVGARSLFIPEKGAARGGSRPNVSWTHHQKLGGLSGFQYWHIDDSCSLPVNRENKDDVLTVAERKEYDAFVAELREWVEQW